MVQPPKDGGKGGNKNKDEDDDSSSAVGPALGITAAVLVIAGVVYCKCT